jgi:hypothetical protein
MDLAVVRRGRDSATDYEGKNMGQRCSLGGRSSSPACGRNDYRDLFFFAPEKCCSNRSVGHSTAAQRNNKRIRVVMD